VAAATILTIVPAHADPFTVTYEAAGVQNTTASFDYVGVENFDGLTTGTGESFTTSYGTTASSAYQMSGAYSGVQINAADQYGGAGGTGKYAVTFSSAGYTLMLSSTNTTTGQAAPIDYRAAAMESQVIQTIQGVMGQTLRERHWCTAFRQPTWMRSLAARAPTWGIPTRRSKAITKTNPTFF